VRQHDLEMTADRPPAAGRIIVVEPFVPEDQTERRFVALGPNVGFEPTWVFEVDEPLGWKGAATTRLLLAPRSSGTWAADANTHIVASGCLWFDDPGAEYCGLIAQLETQ
jgi:hypothetical protein